MMNPAERCLEPQPDLQYDKEPDRPWIQINYGNLEWHPFSSKKPYIETHFNSRVALTIKSPFFTLIFSKDLIDVF